MGTKPSSIQYRYLNLEKLGEQFHLKDVVVDVLKRSSQSDGVAIFEDVSARKKDLDQDGSFVVLNKLSEASHWNGPVICGQLIHVKSGMQIPGIDGSLDQSIPELELQNLSIGDSKQLVQGVLYFAIAHNHVGIIEGQRTKARTLERYLTRLLQDAGELEAGDQILLNAKLEGAVQAVQELDITPRKSMATSPDVIMSSEVAEEESEGTTVFDVLKLMGWSAADLENLQTSVPDDGWIEGLFKIKFKRKGRRAASVDRSVLETALRNLDPASIGLLGESAKESSGVIKLSERKAIQTSGDLLDPEQAMNAIIEMLKKWASTGRIDYDFTT